MKWFLPLLAFAALLPLSLAAETTTGPAITTLPVTIAKSGVFHFTKNLGYGPATGIAINITAADVVLDMNGYQLGAVSGTTSTSIGINCSGNRVTIKNGAVLGFRSGLVISSNNASITDLLVTNNYGSGIIVVGNNVQILRNRVNNTGGAPNVSIPYSIGISLTGTYANVSDNNVQNTYAPDVSGHYANGIRLLDCTNVVLSNNRILDVEPATPTNATSTGIATITSTDLIFLGNTASTVSTGFDLSGGASGKYGDNITNSVATDYFTTGSGMISIGNNN